MELLNVHHKHHGPTDGNFYWARNERPGWRGFKGHHIDELLSALAVLGHHTLEFSEFGLFHSNQKRRVPLTEEPTRRTDHREFESRFDQFVGDMAFIAVVNDAYGELHTGII